MTIDKHQNTNAWALITGASEGIGLAYAEALCQQNKPVILVARNEHKLIEQSSRLQQAHGVEVKYFVADLSRVDGVQKLIDDTQNLNIDLLVNNAGKEESGSFLEIEVDQMVDTIFLNCSAPMILSHHFGKKMALKKKGEIVFLASIVAFQGVPMIANYAASKSFVLTLAEGLAAEFKADNVNVQIVAPGFTKTNLSPELNFSRTPLSPLTADFVARYSLKRLGRKTLAIPGFINQFLFYSGKYLQPRWLNTFAFGQVFKLVLRDKLSRVKMHRSASS